MTVVSFDELRVGMHVRSLRGKKTWRVAAIDQLAPSPRYGRWVMLQLLERPGKRFIHEAAINDGWLTVVE